MLKYTLAAIKKTIQDIKNLVFVFNVLVIWSSIAYLIYSSFTGIGNVYANSIVCLATFAYFIFYVLSTKKTIKKSEFEASKHIYKIIKLTVNAVVLLIAIYGIIIGTISNSSAIKTYLLLIIWVLQVIVELLALAIETRLEMFKAAFYHDFSAIVKIVNVFKEEDIVIPDKNDPYIIKLSDFAKKDKEDKKSIKTTKRRAKIQNFKDKLNNVLVKK